MNQIDFFTICSIRGQLKLRAAGLRGRATLRQLLDAAGRHTGRAYTSRQLTAAIADLQSIINKELHNVQ